MNPELLRLLAGIQARRRGIGPTTALESLFVGQDNPRAPFGVNEQARRGALTRAGLTGFLALGEGGGLLDVIGASGLAGRAAREDITNELIKPIDLETEVVQLENGKTILVNKQTGQVIADLGGEEADEEGERELLAPVKVQLPNGDIVFGTFDKNRGMFLDTQTGMPLPAARPILEEEEDKSFSRIDTLSDNFRIEAGNLQDSVRQAEVALRAPSNAIGHQTLVVAYNKLIDPTSVVRESEFARTASIGGFSAQAQQFANRILSDGRLSPESERQLREEIKRLGGERRSQVNEIAQRFISQAREFNLNPEFVVGRRLLEGLDPNAPPATGTAPGQSLSDDNRFSDIPVVRPRP